MGTASIESVMHPGHYLHVSSRDGGHSSATSKQCRFAEGDPSENAKRFKLKDTCGVSTIESLRFPGYFFDANHKSHTQNGGKRVQRCLFTRADPSGEEWAKFKIQ